MLLDTATPIKTRPVTSPANSRLTKITWWLRVVGSAYLLAAGVNLYFVSASPKVFTDNLPYPADDIVLRAFSDAWLVFALALGALGAMMLYASRHPGGNRLLVMTVILMEVVAGVIADTIWIARGHPPVIYIPFIVVHLVIIGTGITFLGRESAEKSPS